MSQAGITFGPGTVVGQPQVTTISTTGGGDVYQAQLAALRDSGLVGRAVIKSVEDLGVVIQGDKVERFHQTMAREWAHELAYRSHRERNQVLPHWQDHYNRRRPHSSLGDRPSSQPRSPERIPCATEGRGTAGGR